MASRGQLFCYKNPGYVEVYEKITLLLIWFVFSKYLIMSL